MSKIRKKRAFLELAELKRVRAVAQEQSPMIHALLEWLCTNGARASEPGLARMRDVDLRAGTVQLTHLKGGLAAEPMPLAEPCREALRAWLAVKPRGDYIFPSAKPSRCYPCRGEGHLLVKRHKKPPETQPCPHCHATGKRQGITRHEVSRVVGQVFALAGIPPELHFPHVLRHSAVTRMLDSGITPTAIQQRVGHKTLTTTYGYMHTTVKAREEVNKAFDF